LRAEVARLGTYSDDDLKALRPLFVSRAPQRRNGGAAHKETIYAKPHPDHRHGGEKSERQDLVPASHTQGVGRYGSRTFSTRRRERKNMYSDRLSGLVAAWNGNLDDNAFEPLANRPLTIPSPDKDGFSTKAGAIRSCVHRTRNQVRNRQCGSGQVLKCAVGSPRTTACCGSMCLPRRSKFHLVPVYVHHRVKGLPNRAIVAYKDETEWTDVADTDFIFSLYPKRLSANYLEERNHSSDISLDVIDRTGAVSLWAHDRTPANTKDGLIRGIGVKTAMSVEKLSVDVLGHIFPAPHEVRRGLA
jgi:CRISPR-associated endonuclease Csn1